MQRQPSVAEAESCAQCSALEQMDRAGFNQRPVVEDSRIVGMLSREDVISFLRTLQEVGA